MNEDSPGARLFAPQRWAEVRALADRLDALAAGERLAEIERLAATDAELARLVSSLLGQNDITVAEPLHDVVGRLLVATTDGGAPERIGPFRLLHRIGTGGMGVVYLAEREGTDFTQRVALKLLDGDAARMARFAARERRILSSLTHPNITAFVDAGESGGRTWLAMEYVDGLPLLDHCSSRELDLRERVALFTQVCAAVAHAHSQLVVHRDLKPSNVLVSQEGAAKLLDFGIAQILDATDQPAPATRVFTPEYAAPEQLRGDHATTATDVYSLGLLLYELVTGRRLPTIERHADDDWTTGQLARLATTQPAGLSAARALMSGDARQLARQLRGDLGRIIAHAVAADPGHRYPSVLSLREDLDRWLEYRPLTIERRRFSYVATRFVRRHRVAVAVAAGAVVALVALSAVALWQARRATLMAAHADRARLFLADMFAATDPYSVRRGGRSAAELLTNGARRIDRQFGDSPRTQAELRVTIASVLDRIGEPKQARDLMERSVEQLREVYGTHAQQVGAALEKLALAREDSGDLEGAHDAFAESYSILRGTGPEYVTARIGAVTGLAKLANLRGDHADAERMHEAVLKERMESEGPESPDIAMDLMNLAADSLYAERFAQSEALAQRAHAMLEHTVGARHPRFIYVDNVLGLAQAQAGHSAASIATLHAAVEIARRNLQPGAPMIGGVLASLGSALLTAGQAEDAVPLLTEARNLNDANKYPRRAATAMLLGLAQLQTGHPAEALTTLRAARAVMEEQTAVTDVVYSCWSQAALGAALAATGDTVEGERNARAARATLLASPRSDSVRLGEIDLLLADVLDHSRRADEAHSLRGEALATFTRVYGPDHPRTRVAAAALSTPGSVAPPS